MLPFPPVKSVLKRLPPDRLRSASETLKLGTKHHLKSTGNVRVVVDDLGDVVDQFDDPFSQDSTQVPLWRRK
jgi:hypothetical protein